MFLQRDGVEMGSGKEAGRKRWKAGQESRERRERGERERRERERRVEGRRMEKQGCKHEGVQSRHKGDRDSVHHSFYKITFLLDTNWHTLTSTPVHLLVDPL